MSWACTAVALAFLVFRIFVRIKSFKRMYADDFLVISAWAMILASSIIWQTQKHALYAQYALTTESLTPHVISQEQTLLRIELVIIMMFYCSLWCVKLSILLFFRRLQQGQSIRKQEIWWWCVFGFTVATWVICIGLIQYQCLARSFESIVRKYNSSLAISKPFKFYSQLLLRPPNKSTMEDFPYKLRRGRAF